MAVYKDEVTLLKMDGRDYARALERRITRRLRNEIDVAIEAEIDRRVSAGDAVPSIEVDEDFVLGAWAKAAQKLLPAGD